MVIMITVMRIDVMMFNTLNGADTGLKERD